MRSQAQIEASRRNGAKSTGPKNRHNVALANSFTLDYEDGEQFLIILENYLNYLLPLGPVETDLVETMAVCKWKQWRFLSAEKVTVDLESRRDPGDSPAYRNPNAAAIARALTRVNESPGSLKTLNVDGFSLDRQYHRSLNMLLKLQDRRPKSPVAPPCDPEDTDTIFSGFSGVSLPEPDPASDSTPEPANVSSAPKPAEPKAFSNVPIHVHAAHTAKKMFAQAAAPAPASEPADPLANLPEKNNPTTQAVLQTNVSSPPEPEEPRPFLNVPLHVPVVHAAEKVFRQAAALTYDD